MSNEFLDTQCKANSKAQNSLAYKFTWIWSLPVIALSVPLLRTALQVRQYKNDDGYTWNGVEYLKTENVYDELGKLIESKVYRDDNQTLATTYEYDSLDRLTKTILPDGDWTEVEYNSLGQVIKGWTRLESNNNNPPVKYTYDDLNRLELVEYFKNYGDPDGSISYAYDDNNNPLSVTTDDGSQTYTYDYFYDQLNRLREWDNGLLDRTMFYDYDSVSNRTRMHVERNSDGVTEYDVTYTYDEASRLLSVTDVFAAKTASYEYFDIGGLKEATNPNGTQAVNTLDNLHRLDLLEYKFSDNSLISSLDYTYDPLSNVTQLVRNDSGIGGISKSFDFGYDTISRLISADYDGEETVDYTYDNVGNRLSLLSDTDGLTSYTIAGNSNQLDFRSQVPEDEDFTSMSYTYDDEGKLTTRYQGNDSDDFTYSFGSQLTQIDIVRGGTTQQTVNYSYDGGGQRVKVTDSNGTRYFLYDGGMPVMEFDGNMNSTSSYLYGANGVVYRRKHQALRPLAFRRSRDRRRVHAYCT